MSSSRHRRKAGADAGGAGRRGAGIVAEKGFAAASLDEIAARAGMTKGAIYSNFAGKAELLLAAVSARGLQPCARSIPGPPPRSPRGWRRWRRSLPPPSTAPRAARFAAESQLYALSDPELRAGLAETDEQNFAAVAERLARYGDLKPGVTARELAVGLQSVCWA